MDLNLEMEKRRELNSQELNKAVIEWFTCKDGFKISIQASEFHYCSPRMNDGWYSSVELGYPSERDDLIMEYAEDQDNPTETVYGWVPIEVVEELLKKHGGICRDE